MALASISATTKCAVLVTNLRQGVATETMRALNARGLRVKRCVEPKSVGLLSAASLAGVDAIVVTIEQSSEIELQASERAAKAHEIAWFRLEAKTRGGLGWREVELFARSIPAPPPSVPALDAAPANEGSIAELVAPLTPPEAFEHIMLERDEWRELAEIGEREKAAIKAAAEKATANAETARAQTAKAHTESRKATAELLELRRRFADVEERLQAATDRAEAAEVRAQAAQAPSDAVKRLALLRECLAAGVLTEAEAGAKALEIVRAAP